MQYIKNENTKCTCSNPRHHAKWILNETGIIKSVENVLKSGDSEKLTKDAYQFLMNMSGFIAHYDINGFMAEYSNIEDLRRDIASSSDVGDKRYIQDDYFTAGEQSEYYAAKHRINQKLGELAKKYEQSTQAKEAKAVSDKISLLEELVKRAKTDDEFAKTITRKFGLL